MSKRFEISLMLLMSSSLMTSPAWSHDTDQCTQGEVVACHEEVGDKLPDDPIWCDGNNVRKEFEGSANEDQKAACAMLDNNSLWSPKAISNIGLEKGQLLLTIDDGPRATVTPKILDLLKQYNIKASFFVVGSQIKSNAAIVNQAIQAGHTIGNHTLTHNLHLNSGNMLGVQSELTLAHNALFDILDPKSKEIMQHRRLFFRAPGIPPTAPYAETLNADKFARKYIGPIHANLGTDQPRADWACWSQGTSVSTCAGYYYQDIMKAGRGIILSHDIYDKNGVNTYEMLKILLQNLHEKGGGIKNKDGKNGLWTFVDIQENPVLAKFDADPNQPINPAQPANGNNAGPNNQPAAACPAGQLSFEKGNVANVRSAELATAEAINADTLITISTVDEEKTRLTTNLLKCVEPLQEIISIGDSQFRKVKIISMKAGYKNTFVGQYAYIWTKMFPNLVGYQ